jgi:glutamine synthetase
MLRSVALRVSVRGSLARRSMASRAKKEKDPLKAVTAQSEQAVAELGFGSRVFNPALLPTETRKALDARLTRASAEPLSSEHRSVIADVVGKWAMANGATNISHWFAPLRNSGAEKHDSFKDYSGRFELGASKLFKGETDGSSFPNGGLRSTHTAAAYTAWDMTSMPFIRNRTLYVPAVFVTHNGDPLGEKLPLLRSMEAVNEQSLRLLRALGDKEVARVDSNVGWEQEFFVVDQEAYDQRPDLVHCGRTLFGAKPHRGQQLETNYFGQVPPRVREYLYDVQSNLFQLGVSLATFHNEVAPGQHELSPIFTLLSRASDQNLMTMEVMREVAAKHGLAVLFHEKPFAGVNGSGKHNNWGLNAIYKDGRDENLFVPSADEAKSARFIAMVSALAHAVNAHGDLLRIGVASAHNDHRLGAQEAPPAIISLYTGAHLEAHLRRVVAGGPLAGYTSVAPTMDFNVPSVTPMKSAVEDRNRTAPFPFCGNRFEFRAVGGSQNISFPLTLLSTAVADGLADLAGHLERGKSLRDAVAEQLAGSMRVVFNGNGYSEEWQQEAERRGLPNLRSTPDAIERLDTAKNRELLARFGVFKEHVLGARAEILYHNYVQTLVMEGATMSDMLHTGFMPAFQKDVANMQSVFAPLNEQRKTIYTNIATATAELDQALEGVFASHDHHHQALYCRDVLKVKMAAVRRLVDRAEVLCPKEFYPYPRYDRLLLGHHSEDAASW